MRLQDGGARRGSHRRGREEERLAEPDERVHDEHVKGDGEKREHPMEVHEHHAPAKVFLERLLEHGAQALVPLGRAVRGPAEVAEPGVRGDDGIGAGRDGHVHALEHRRHRVAAPKRLVHVVVPDAPVQALGEVHAFHHGAVERRDDALNEVALRERQARAAHCAHGVGARRGRRGDARCSRVVRKREHLRQQPAVRSLRVHELKQHELVQLGVQQRRAGGLPARSVVAVHVPEAGGLAWQRQVLELGVRQPSVVPGEGARVQRVRRVLGGRPARRRRAGDEHRALRRLRQVPQVLGEAVDDQLARGLGRVRGVREGRTRLEPEQVAQRLGGGREARAPRLDALLNLRAAVGRRAAAREPRLFLGVVRGVARRLVLQVNRERRARGWLGRQQRLRRGRGGELVRRGSRHEQRGARHFRARQRDERVAGHAPELFPLHEQRHE